MKRKILAAIVALSMMLTLFPAGAFAADGPDPSITDIPDGLVIEGTVVTDYTGDATELTIPDGVTEIGMSAFIDNTTITSITLPESVKKIGNQAFWDTTNLKTLNMPGVTTIDGYQAFINTGLETLDMPEVTTIGERAFYGADELTSVSMPKVETIGKEAFSSTALKNVVIPESVQSIGESFLWAVDPETLSISIDTLLQATIDESAFNNAFSIDVDTGLSKTQIILRGVTDEDVVLLPDGIRVGDVEKHFSGGGGLYSADLYVTQVQEPQGGSITNQTGVPVTVGDETVQNGSIKPISSAASDAYLSMLSLDGVALEPVFGNLTDTYTAQVNYTVESVDVTARPSSEAAKVSVNGTTADSANSYVVNVPLAEGANTITVQVTAEDGTAKTYTITVQKEAQLAPLQIGTPEELMAFAEAVNRGEYTGVTDAYVELTADIDMSGKDWTPIGETSERYFSGIFEGNGHKIDNLTIDTTDETADDESERYYGLFGYVTGTVQHTNVSGTISGEQDCEGSMAGLLAGITLGTINDCSTSGTITSDGVVSQYVGGLVGYADSGVIKNSGSNVAITIGAGYYTGGITSVAYNTRLENCINNGDVVVHNGAGYSYVGGIVGTAQGGSDIGYSVNNGSIDATTFTSAINKNLAGICAETYVAKVHHCANNGAITGAATTFGGIVGTMWDASDSVENCINTGNLTNNGGRNTGGIVSSGASGATVANNISLGMVTADGTNYGPIAAVPGSATYTNNHYLATILCSTDPEPTGATAFTEMTQDVIDAINAAGGDYRLDENGNVEVVPLSYTLTIEGSEAETTGAGSYEAGTEVAIDAGTRSGYDFAGWTSTAGSFADASAAQTTFTMPAEDVTITANWKEKPSTPSGPIIPSKPDEDIDIDESDHGSVEVTPEKPEAGDEVVITPTPDEGYAVDDVIVKDEDGNVVDVTDNGDGTFTFTMPEGGVTITVTFKEKTASVLDIFNDLVPSAWYIDAVQYAYDHGLMTGTSATTFSPNATTTRGMIVAILHRQEGEPVVNYLMTFDDVAEGAYYAEAVRWAASEGVVNGYSASAFGPGDAITREQLAAILYNYAAYKGMDTSARADLSSYSDAASVSAWAEDAMQWTVEEGLLRGVTNDTLDPQGAATRVQVAAILQRFLEA